MIIFSTVPYELCSSKTPPQSLAKIARNKECLGYFMANLILDLFTYTVKNVN